MNALLVFAIALASRSSAWFCGFLVLWLWRHRHAPMPRRRRAGYRLDPPSPHVKPPWARDKVLYLATHLHGCRSIAHTFNRWHGSELTIGKTWVWPLMRKHQAEIEELRRQCKRRKPHLIPPGHAWALDLTFIASPFGPTFAVLGVIDAGSRKLLRLKRLPGKCAFIVLGHLLIAIGQHGLPLVLRTDNEAMFTSKLWCTALKALASRIGAGRHVSPGAMAASSGCLVL